MLCFVFFFKQKTAYERRISDWSSDVCSSDLHARLVLEHLPQREAVVAKLAAALRPGGWLVVQDYDIRTMAVAEPPHDGWQACAHAMPAMMQSAGTDPLCGSQLVGLLRRAGLVDITAEGHLRSLPKIGRAHV